MKVHQWKMKEERKRLGNVMRSKRKLTVLDSNNRRKLTRKIQKEKKQQNEEKS